MIVTIQPPGVSFDPPAVVTFPNADGLPAGAVTEMFSFDHDLGMFVSIGTGTVSEDGLIVRSDPGFGVVKGGWHCAAPTTPSGCCTGGGPPGGGGGEQGGVIFVCPGETKTIPASAPGSGVTCEWSTEDDSIATVGPTTISLCEVPAADRCSKSRASCSTTVTGHDPGLTAAVLNVTACDDVGTALHKNRRSSRLLGSWFREICVSPVRVKRVTFSGDTFRHVHEDPPGDEYAAPHWADEEGNGEFKTAPVSFLRSATIGAMVTLDVCGDIPGDSFTLTGIGSEGGATITLIGEHVGALATGEVQINVTGQGIDHVRAFDTPLRWYLQASQGGPSYVGLTRNNIYFRLASLSPEFEGFVWLESVLDISCRNATGATSFADFFSRLWTNGFARESSTWTCPTTDAEDLYGRLSCINFDGTGPVRSDGVPLRYWEDESRGLFMSIIEHSCSNMDAMLTRRSVGQSLDGIGTCQAFQQLMLNMLWAHGFRRVPDPAHPEHPWVTDHQIVAESMPFDDGAPALEPRFLVPCWSFPEDLSCDNSKHPYIYPMATLVNGCRSCNNFRINSLGGRNRVAGDRVLPESAKA